MWSVVSAKSLIVTLASSDLLNSLVRGLFESNSNTKHVCTTGNCTWSPFSSLGVCSSCQQTKAAAACNSISANFSGQCVYNSFDPDPYRAGEKLYAAAGTAPLIFSSSFAQIAIILRDDSANNWNNQPAYLRTLSLCRKTYSRTNFTEGILYDEADDWEALVPHGQPDLNQQEYLYSFRTQTDKTHNGSSGTLYRVNWNDISAVGDAAKPLFWTTLLTTLGANNYVASALYRRNGGNIPKTMDAVATSMTNQTRQGPNATQAHGTALAPEVYIHVSWLWLIFPTALVLLSVAFLTVTAGFSAGERQVVWKSSTLASLFHGIHGRKEEAKLRSATSMRQAAEEIYVLLRDDDEGHVALLPCDKDSVRKRKI